MIRRDVRRGAVFTRRALLIGGTQTLLLGSLAVRLRQVQVPEHDAIQPFVREHERHLVDRRNVLRGNDGFLVDVGWGTYGFKAGPVSGEVMAQLVATGKTPELIASFDLARFAEGRLVGEKGAAAVGH